VRIIHVSALIQTWRLPNTKSELGWFLAFCNACGYVLCSVIVIFVLVLQVLWKRGGLLQESPTDQGQYRCVARNSVGALVSRSARLRVASKLSCTLYTHTRRRKPFRTQRAMFPKASGLFIKKNSVALVL
jgi:hypothetical protein